MDLTFLGRGWISLLECIPLLVLLSMFVDVRRERGSRLKIQLRANSLLAVRNLAGFTSVLGSLAIVGGVIQKLGAVKSTIEVRYQQGIAPQASGAMAHILYGSVSSAQATVGRLSNQANQLIAAKFAVDQLTWLAIGITVFLIARAAYAGVPFQAKLVRLLRWDAGIVLVFQTLSQYIDGVLNWKVSQELFAANAQDQTLPQAIGQYFNFPMWQLGFALLLLVVANIFSRGASLVRDTDGLV
jgi:hypothetical protein